jgi:hypothetical protein
MEAISRRRHVSRRRFAITSTALCPEKISET